MPSQQSFKDLKVTFKSHPVTGDLMVTKDDAAVKQSVVNLLLTVNGERPFDDQIGTNLSALLFEPLDYATAAGIRQEIKQVIKLYEPRVELISTDVEPSFNDNAFDVHLEFTIRGREDNAPLDLNFPAPENPMKYIQVNNLDFNDIKSTLKDYLRAQTDFTDFDFEGSVWANLLDVLAYNTYYTAFNTNMVVNEMFLESATLRDNVVTLAKQLGYKPKSVVSPQAIVNFQVNFDGTYPSTVTLKKGTGFVTSFDDKLYRFVAIDDYKVGVINGQAIFTGVELYEGTVVEDTFTVRSSLNNQKFVLSNPSADTSTIRVKVFPIENSTEFAYYNQIESIIDIGASDKIFYVDENLDERYELFFGDGVIGSALEHNNYLEASYLVSNGACSKWCLSIHV